MTSTIRKATPEDIPSLSVIRKQATEAGFTNNYPRSDFADLVATADDRLRDWIATAHKLVIVAETDLTPVAYAAYDLHSARILALYTAPEYQGKGCASALLERIEDKAKRDGKDRLQATVPKNAVRFFRHRGFQCQRTSERHGISMVVCVKPLS